MFKSAFSAILCILSFSICTQGQQIGSVTIEFPSQGSQVHGRVFPAGGEALRPTLLLVPGFPGNPNDVAGMGDSLSRLGINVVMFNPRGMHASEGSFSFEHTIEDIGAALRWLERDEVRQRFKIDPGKVTLGGHSYGGGMAMVYAAKDTRVRRLISISGADTGETIRELQRNPASAEAMRKSLSGMLAQRGPVRMDNVETAFQEISKLENVYVLSENAANLADRSILLIGAWEDVQVTVDQTVLPFYRALKRSKAADVTFLVYHADHQFGAVRERLASDIRDWLMQQGGR
jgi:pimeloyl-ACP methyl ester carboxylesterase